MATSQGCRFPTDTPAFEMVRSLYAAGELWDDELLAERARAALREYAAPYLRQALPHANARGKHGPKRRVPAPRRYKIQEER